MDKTIKQKDIPLRNHLSRNQINKLHNRYQYECSDFYISKNFDKDGNYIGEKFDDTVLMFKLKPNGLWYSKNWYWLDNLDNGLDYHSVNYGESVDKEYNYSNYFYSINIDDTVSISEPSDKNKLLILNNKQERDIFKCKYKLDMPSKYEILGAKINWSKVSQDYAGIELNNITANTQLTERWYYGWDVPSGCIWNVDVITSYTLI